MENAQIAAENCLEFLKSGDADGLRRALEQDPAAAETRDATGVSLLMHCLYRGRRDLADLVANKKKSLDIFEATSLGNLERLKQCLREDASAVGSKSVNSRSGDGFTALHFSCFFGQPAATRLLIDNGAAVDAVAANGMKVMPLHSAASARNLEAARLLLEHGAPVNARQHGGWTPLHAAAQNGDCPMVELLLKHGADSKQPNDAGTTPTMSAKEKGDEELAALLN